VDFPWFFVCLPGRVYADTASWLARAGRMLGHRAGRLGTPHERWRFWNGKIHGKSQENPVEHHKSNTGWWYGT